MRGGCDRARKGPKVVPKGVDANDLIKAAYHRYDLSLGAGLNKVAGKVFRIGHLGWLNEIMVLQALGGVELAMRDVGIAFEPGSGVGAAVRRLCTTGKAMRIAAESGPRSVFFAGSRTPRAAGRCSISWRPGASHDTHRLPRPFHHRPLGDPVEAVVSPRMGRIRSHTTGPGGRAFAGRGHCRVQQGANPARRDRTTARPQDDLRSGDRL